MVDVKEMAGVGFRTLVDSSLLRPNQEEVVCKRIEPLVVPGPVCTCGWVGGGREFHDEYVALCAAQAHKRTCHRKGSTYCRAHIKHLLHV